MVAIRLGKDGPSGQDCSGCDVHRQCMTPPLLFLPHVSVQPSPRSTPKASRTRRRLPLPLLPR
ncbi:Hypothetical predicted protein [Podarcis lilfordi]|uniref:Uncharacterized protein n=1 Tax=Podarcis lilfordi TaxID=74358 RepID=A0AA35JLK0_9SAUR|nr:Hypothetical predicted protein [Podarcis lilfordi]